MPPRYLAEDMIGSVLVSSAPDGRVGSVVAQALGSATLLAQGQYTGDDDVIYTVEIDSVSAGSEVGQATYRWKCSDCGDAWQATGQTTSGTLTTLNAGVQIRFLSGSGDDFALGDAWTIRAARPRGRAALANPDPNEEWRSTGVTAERIALDLGSAQEPTAVVLGYTNLGASATVTLSPGGLLAPAPGRKISAAETTAIANLDGGAFPHAAGRLSLTWIPDEAWGDVATSTYFPIVAINGGAQDLLYAYSDGSHGYIASYDGASEAAHELDWAAGTAYEIVLSWSGSSFAISVDGDAGGAQTYDGAFPVGDDLVLAPASALGMTLLDVLLYNTAAAPIPVSLSRVAASDGAHWLAWLTSPGSRRYWIIDLADSGNADGYLRAALVYLGGWWSPARAQTFSFGRSLRAVAQDRQAGGNLRGRVVRGLAWSIELPHTGMSAADLATLETLFAAQHVSQARPNWLVLDPVTPADVHFGLFAAEISRSALSGSGAHHQVTLSFAEVPRT